MTSTSHSLLLLAASVVVGCGDRPTPAVSPGPAPAPVAPLAPFSGGTSGVDNCEIKGGICVGVSECGPTSGHLMAEAGCGVAHLACCSEGADSCGGRETWACCRNGLESRPFCKDGGLTCLNGAVTGSLGGCAGKQ